MTTYLSTSQIDTLNQQIDIATMHIMAYDEALEACDVVDFESEYLTPVVRDPESWRAVAREGRRHA